NGERLSWPSITPDTLFDELVALTCLTYRGVLYIHRGDYPHVYLLETIITNYYPDVPFNQAYDERDTGHFTTGRFGVLEDKSVPILSFWEDLPINTEVADTLLQAGYIDKRFWMCSGSKHWKLSGE